jgi:RHS repeat-associated protein
LISGNLGIDQSVTSGTTTYFIRNNTGTLIGEHVGSTSYYYLHDNEGSVVAVISSSGAVQDRDAYDPYGNVTSSSGSVSNPFGYVGGYTDSATGLVKFGTRYYNPAIGVFTQEDATRESSGYGYAGDDPVSQVDPSGDITCPSYIPGCGVVTDIQNTISGAGLVLTGEAIEAAETDGISLLQALAGLATTSGIGAGAVGVADGACG